VRLAVSCFDSSVSGTDSEFEVEAAKANRPSVRPLNRASIFKLLTEATATRIEP
jgi:hypothetical protein